MGNFPTKAEKDFNITWIRFPGRYYDYFTNENSGDNIVRIQVKDAIKIFAAFAEKTKDDIFNRSYAYMNAEHMLRELLKVKTDSLPVSAIKKLKLIAFYIPASYLESEKTEDLSGENLPSTFEIADDIIIPPAAATETILVTSEKLISSETGDTPTQAIVKEQRYEPISLLTLPSSHVNVTTEGGSEDDEDDNVSTFSTQCGSICTDGTTSSRQSRRGQRLTSAQKIQEVFNSLVMSEFRLAATSILKEKLTDDDTSVNRYAHEIFLELVKDMISKRRDQKSTRLIIEATSNRYKDDTVKEFCKELLNQLAGYNDDRPNESKYDLIRFLSRLSTVLRGKQDYYFKVTFSAERPFFKKQKDLGKALETYTVKLITAVCQESLTPLCCAAIDILRHPDKSGISFSAPAERFQLMARIIYRTSVLNEKMVDILTHLQQKSLVYIAGQQNLPYIAKEILHKLKSEDYLSLPDQFEKAPDLNKQKISANCFAFIFKECSRQLLRLKQDEDFSLIQKLLRKSDIQAIFLKKADEIQAKIEQSTSSEKSATASLTDVSATMFRTSPAVTTDNVVLELGCEESKGVQAEAAAETEVAEKPLLK